LCRLPSDRARVNTLCNKNAAIYIHIIHQIVDINNGRAIQVAPIAMVSKSEAELLIKISPKDHNDG
jgi:hypothetical protein